jgi:hypothetical protein
MLFNKTNNKAIINIFNILCEVFIGFSVFALFFGIFMIYFFTDYNTFLIGKFINKSISFYNSHDSFFAIKNVIKSHTEERVSSYKEQLKANVEKDEKEVNEYNIPYDNKLMIIILYMIFGMLFILELPVLLGIIGFDQINFKYLGISLLSHIILIVGFELLLLLLIISYLSPVKLYTVFQNNKTQTGQYI